MNDRGTRINPIGSAYDELSFHADAVLPAQFYPARRRATSVEPILRLMAGILIDAVRCFQTNFESRDTKRRGEFREAELWIFHDRGDGPFSFENVCGALEIDPHRLRELIVRWEKDRGSRVTSSATRALRSRVAGLIQSQHRRISVVLKGPLPTVRSGAYPGRPRIAHPRKGTQSQP
jgi:hypothetical protein